MLSLLDFCVCIFPFLSPAYTSPLAPIVLIPTYSHHYLYTHVPRNFSASKQRSRIGLVAMYWSTVLNLLEI